MVDCNDCFKHLQLTCQFLIQRDIQTICIHNWVWNKISPYFQFFYEIDNEFTILRKDIKSVDILRYVVFVCKYTTPSCYLGMIYYEYLDFRLVSSFQLYLNSCCCPKRDIWGNIFGVVGNTSCSEKGVFLEMAHIFTFLPTIV